MELGKAIEGLGKLRKLAFDFKGYISIVMIEFLWYNIYRCDGVIEVSEKMSLVPLIPRETALETFEIFFTAFFTALPEERTLEEDSDRDYRTANEVVDEFGENLGKLQKGLRLLHISFPL